MSTSHNTQTHHTGTQQACIAYLTHTYPNYSTTFTHDELKLLTNCSLDIKVYSLRKPPHTYMTAELLSEFRKTKYLRPIPLSTMVQSHRRAFLRAPRLYLKTLLAVFSASLSSPVQMLKSLMHFLEAVPLGQEFSATGVGLVHVQFADTAATYAAVIHRLYHIPYSVAIHAHDIFERRFTPSLIRLRVENARRIRVISAFNKQWLVERVGIAPDKIDVIHCGVDIQKFRLTVSLSASPPLLLAVGRLVDYKGFIYLLQACRAVLDKGHKFSCKIIGSGPEHDALKESIQELGLDGHVELLGVVQHGDIAKYFAQATVFVLPCCQGANGAMDGIPVALMEAMAMGIPVVSTEVSGIPELIEPGVSGLLVLPKDSAALAQSINMLLQNESLRHRLSKNAREKILTDFNLEKNVAQLAKMLSLTS